MNPAGRYYRLTAEGRSLWSRRQTVELPLDYRRILGLVDFAGHQAVIAGYLARYPAATVEGWLAEFEALRLIEAVEPPPAKSLRELAAEKSVPPLEAEDLAHYDPEASFADVSLARLGVYVNYERIAHRVPGTKSPRETVALVVEDDPDQLALAVLRLTLAGYPVRTADGVQGLFRQLGEGLPDAIFLDVMLWDGNGFDALGTLRRHPQYAHLPVIMVTSRAEPEAVATGLALGCDGYITKPYAANTLEYVLRYVMKQEIALDVDSLPAPDLAH